MERRVAQVYSLALTISVRRRKGVDGCWKKGQREASDMEAFEADGWQEPLAAANGRDCLPEATSNSRQRSNDT